MYALIKNGQSITGMTRTDLVANSGQFVFDIENGKLIFSDGKADTITYNHELTDQEKVRYMTDRALTILKDWWGWTFYKEA